MGTPANSINEGGASGLANFDGVATFSTTPLTQYCTLSAATNNTINNISPGSAGFVLTSNGPTSQPTYQASSGGSSIARTFLLMGG